MKPKTRRPKPPKEGDRRRPKRKIASLTRIPKVLLLNTISSARVTTTPALPRAKGEICRFEMYMGTNKVHLLGFVERITQTHVRIRFIHSKPIGGADYTAMEQEMPITFELNTPTLWATLQSAKIAA